MRHSPAAIVVLCVLARSSICQAAPIKDPVLERLAGTWVLRGTIAGKQTTHDVVAEWVLGHEYLRLHETSREKDDKGQARYEAIVLIGWEEASSEFQCLWLDTTGGGGLTAQAIGHGKRSGEAIPFLFRERDGSVSFNNTFSYDKARDSWSWHMDNVQNGKAVPFGRVTLARQ
jgi:hypothetical protein